MVDSPSVTASRSPEAATKPLLDVDGLTVSFRQGGRDATVISNLSFAIAPGESVGMVGESGCGKTITGLSLLSLLPPDTRVTGRIGFDSVDLTKLRPHEMQKIRGRRIAMIFQ